MNASHPDPSYRCEAREPGKAPFEFDTPGGDEARAMCDVHGWEFIRIYQLGKDADRPADAPAKGNHPLSGAQMKSLVIECKKSWKLLSEHGVIDQDEDDWRHDQVKSCVGRSGLSACQNSHFAKLMRHFKSLRGEKGAPRAATGQQSSEGGDTLQRREQLLALLAHALGTHARLVANPETLAESRAAANAKQKGGVINEAYLMSIARAKNPGVTLHDCGCLLLLTAAKLEHLLFTLRNRIASREGRGNADKRNKGQRNQGGQA